MEDEDVSFYQPDQPEHPDHPSFMVESDLVPIMGTSQKYHKLYRCFHFLMRKKLVRLT